MLILDRNASSIRAQELSGSSLLQRTRFKVEGILGTLHVYIHIAACTHTRTSSCSDIHSRDSCSNNDLGIRGKVSFSSIQLPSQDFLSD